MHRKIYYYIARKIKHEVQEEKEIEIVQTKFWSMLYIFILNNSNFC